MDKVVQEDHGLDVLLQAAATTSLESIEIALLRICGQHQEQSLQVHPSLLHFVQDGLLRGSTAHTSESTPISRH